MNETLTGDYWDQTLVSALETEKTRTPAALAFRASQVVLGARALFSDQSLRDLLDPPAEGERSASEAHHLFPTAWLKTNGVQERRLINQVANLADVGWHENSLISGRGPADYVPRVLSKLSISETRWGRMCAEHALPPRWETMEYKDFLSERRRRMADLVRVAFRQLGGESDATPITPPWFIPGAEEVWAAIARTEVAMRNVVRSVYSKKFGDRAASKIQEVLSERERDTLKRAMRSRPPGSDPLAMVDYLYLGQLPGLLFQPDAWQEFQSHKASVPELKKRLRTAVDDVVPVRNEIAHVREVERERLLRASLGCAEIMKLLQIGPRESQHEVDILQMEVDQKSPHWLQNYRGQN